VLRHASHLRLCPLLNHPRDICAHFLGHIRTKQHCSPTNLRPNSSGAVKRAVYTEYISMKSIAGIVAGGVFATVLVTAVSLANASPPRIMRSAQSLIVQTKAKHDCYAICERRCAGKPPICRGQCLARCSS
jgi:hypothetical protein